MAEVAPGYVLMHLASERIAPVAQPGQFVHALTDPQGELLRRPFSIQDARQTARGWELELLFSVIGEGTRHLAEKRVGEEVDCLGPQGHPWPMPGGPDLLTRAAQTEPVKPVALVGGGVGVPPLVYLAKALAEQGIAADFYQGARRAELLLMTERIQEYGARQLVATDDGSRGHHGFVTQLLPPINQAEYSAVYACGPLPMLQALAKWAGCATQGIAPPIPLHLSFENKMGCAVGACLGCVIPMRSGKYDRVCTEGPIFRAETVDFAKLVAL